MKLDELTEQSIDYILDNINVDCLNNWENNFIESIAEQWESRRSLSDKQKEVLGRIWDKQP